MGAGVLNDGNLEFDVPQRTYDTFTIRNKRNKRFVGQLTEKCNRGRKTADLRQDFGNPATGQRFRAGHRDSFARHERHKHVGTGS